MDKKKKMQELVSFIKITKEKIEGWRTNIRGGQAMIERATGQGMLLDALIKEELLNIAKKQVTGGTLPKEIRPDQACKNDPTAKLPGEEKQLEKGIDNVKKGPSKPPGVS